MKTTNIFFFLLLFLLPLQNFACSCFLEKLSKRSLDFYDKVFVGKIVDSTYFPAKSLESYPTIAYKIAISKNIKMPDGYQSDTITIYTDLDTCEFLTCVGAQYLFFTSNNRINICTHTIPYYPNYTPYKKRIKRLLKIIKKIYRRYYPQYLTKYDLKI